MQLQLIMIKQQDQIYISDLLVKLCHQWRDNFENEKGV